MTDPSVTGSSATDRGATYWGLALIAFVAEICLVIGAGELGWTLGRHVGMGVGVASAVVGAAGVIVVWGLFFSPKGARRISTWPRAIIGGGAGLAMGAALLALGSQAVGITLLVAGLAVFATQLAMASGATSPPAPAPR